jgi:hypothetical protein
MNVKYQHSTTPHESGYWKNDIGLHCDPTFIVGSCKNVIKSLFMNNNTILNTNIKQPHLSKD